MNRKPKNSPVLATIYVNYYNNVSENKLEWKSDVQKAVLLKENTEKLLEELGQRTIGILSNHLSKEHLLTNKPVATIELNNKVYGIDLVSPYAEYLKSMPEYMGLYTQLVDSIEADLEDYREGNLKLTKEA